MTPDPKLYRFEVLRPEGIPKLTEIMAAFQAVCYPKVTRRRAVSVGICADDGKLSAKADFVTMRQVHQFTREMLVLGYVISAEMNLDPKSFAAVYATRRFPDISLEPRAAASSPPGF
jgi:hypothetical protein